MNVNKELKDAIKWIKYASRSIKHRCFFLTMLGVALLAEHTLVYGTPWHVEQLIFDHGFIGFMLIVIAFVYGSIEYLRRHNHGQARKNN